MEKPAEKKIIVAVTGASGAIYGMQLLEKLNSLKNEINSVAVIFSDNGKKVWNYEIKKEFILPENFVLYRDEDIEAPPASGTAGFTHMIICPCSMATLARIANGMATGLITRAADVMLKERRTLILVPREMPYSLIHIKNMETITLAGGIICPASPSFYSSPVSIPDVINTVIEKIISLCGIKTGIFRWNPDGF